MSNTKTALVRFTPLEPYFLGGESTHGSLGADANYFSQSNPYPQQTTLLGTLRNLLRLAGYDFGASSFSPKDTTKPQYGHLLNISPLFLQNGAGNLYLPQALDRHDNRGQPFQISQLDKEEEWLLFDGEKSFKKAARWESYDPEKAEGYNPKEDLADEWVSLDGERLKPDTIFKTFIRPGIPKRELHKREPDTPGFFKQELIKISDGWSFAVVAEFDAQVDFEKLNGATAQLGGEKSIFQITVKEERRSFEQIFPKEKMYYKENLSNLPRLVLVSDAEMPEEAWKHTAAAATETVDFRHLQTFYDTKSKTQNVKIGGLTKIQPLGKKTDHEKWLEENTLSDKHPLGKSTKFTLLRRGSVLVCPDTTALTALAGALTLEPWRTAGFNHFFTYQPIL